MKPVRLTWLPETCRDAFDHLRVPDNPDPGVRIGDRVRITTQLIVAANDTLWAFVMNK